MNPCPPPTEIMPDTRFTLDSIVDGKHAVLVAPERSDPDRPLVLPYPWLPAEAREGDVLTATPLPDGGVSLKVDRSATRAARERLSHLRTRIPRGPEGDLTL